MRSATGSAMARREVLAFVAVGAVVAVCGHALLVALTAVGVAAGVANAAQIAVTLQLNFLGGRLLTWRQRAGSGSLSGRWLRFHVARGTSALLSVCATVR